MDLHPILRDANRARLVLLATDCWNQTNGITTLYRAVIRCVDERFRGYCRLLIVHPTDHPGEQVEGECRDAFGRLRGRRLQSSCVTLESGQTLLHFNLVEKIGEGGVGAVGQAVDT